jgi:hypothetical protein
VQDHTFHTTHSHTGTGPRRSTHSSYRRQTNLNPDEWILYKRQGSSFTNPYNRGPIFDFKEHQNSHYPGFGMPSRKDLRDASLRRDKYYETLLKQKNAFGRIQSRFMSLFFLTFMLLSLSPFIKMLFV